MKFQVYLVLGTSLSCFSGLAFGQCVVTEDCAALGYTETSCPGNGLKCPFGNGWFCGGDEATICAENGFKYTCTGTRYSGGSGQPCGGKYKTCTCATNYTWNGSSCALSCSSSYKYTCTGTGYAGGAGSACGGKYTQCTCASGYEWKNGKCQKKEIDYSACKLGTLFYSDNTCSDSRVKSKTLLGVVIYEKTESQNGWVMSVNPIATGIAWGPVETTGVTDKAINSSCTNTSKLIALANEYVYENNYKAAIAAHNYNLGGKEWCLPSYALLEYIDEGTNLSKINRGIVTAVGHQLGLGVSSGDASSEEDIWSSSEKDSGYVWSLIVKRNGSSYLGYIGKDNSYKYRSVRAVFSF